MASPEQTRASYFIIKYENQEYKNTKIKKFLKVCISFQLWTMDGPLKSHIILPEINETFIKEVIYRWLNTYIIIKNHNYFPFLMDLTLS